jgi:hypothetical protein
MAQISGTAPHDEAEHHLLSFFLGGGPLTHICFIKDLPLRFNKNDFAANFAEKASRRSDRLAFFVSVVVLA